MSAGVVIDHLFICVPRGAPAAARLIEFGLREGSPNVHPGQGTANRRFFFRNAMLELLWVEDPAEAQAVRELRLWDRWSAAGQACPFGLILRPRVPPARCPFSSWEYRHGRMPDLVLEIACGTALAEPMWAYMAAGRSPEEYPPERRQPLDHPAGVREISRVRLESPHLAADSVTARMVRDGVIDWQSGPAHVMALEFDDGGRARADFRPDLPLVFY